MTYRSYKNICNFEFQICDDKKILLDKKVML